MAYVHEINDFASLEDLRLIWTALLNDTRGANFRQSLDWLQTHWQHTGNQEQPRVFLVISSGQVTGILPLSLRSRRTPAGTVRALTFPVYGGPGFFGPIGPNPTSTWLAVLRHLQQRKRDWDLLDFRGINKVGWDRGRTQAAMRQTGFAPVERTCGASYMLDLPATWDEYLSSRGAEFQRQIDLTEQQAAASGVVSFESYRPRGAAYGDANPRWELFSQCVDLAVRNRHPTATVDRPGAELASLSFLRDAHACACRAGAVDISVVSHDRRPIAFAYNYHWDGALLNLHIGCAPAYSQLQPRDLLLRRVLQDATRKGDRCISFIAGSLGRDCRWTTRVVHHFQYTYYARTSLPGMAAIFSNWLRQRSTQPQTAAVL